MTRQLTPGFNVHTKIILIASALITLSVTTGCAGTGAKMKRVAANESSDYQQQVTTSKDAPVNAARNFDAKASFNLGNDAYRAGDFDEAERQFREVLVHQPRHSKATYNISMIYLRRAYDGLSRYSSLEVDQSRRQHAQSMLLKLDDIGKRN